MTDEWYVCGVYNADANGIWRRRHPKLAASNPNPESIGPQEGDIAIEVRGPLSVVDLDRRALEDRPDIGEIVMRRSS